METTVEVVVYTDAINRPDEIAHREERTIELPDAPLDAVLGAAWSFAPHLGVTDWYHASDNASRQSARGYGESLYVLVEFRRNVHGISHGALIGVLSAWLYDKLKPGGDRADVVRLLHDNRAAVVVPTDRHGESEREQKADETEQRRLDDTDGLVADTRSRPDSTPDDRPHRCGAAHDQRHDDSECRGAQPKEHRRHCRSQHHRLGGRSDARPSRSGSYSWLTARMPAFVAQAARRATWVSENVRS
jgi:hypothetical protein